jgi:bis(5'-nucleosyl)-tetraphosphatase (symmetrical)
MSTYVIGDLQGCEQQTQALLQQIEAAAALEGNPAKILFAGDLINRGPASLACLRRVYAMRNVANTAADTVLGNHDLHLLAVAQGIQKLHRTDTLSDILAAPDCGELLDWLRRRPLAIFEQGHLLVHAGVLPQWSVQQTLSLANEVETVLRGPDWVDFLREMHGNAPAQWNDDLRGVARLRCIVNGLTRLRFCNADGVMDFEAKEGSAPQSPGYMPWFEVPDRQSQDVTVVFGHWSALGLVLRPNLIGLDSGCVWGGKLTAVRLADRALFQVACPQYQAPGAASAK